MIGLVTRYPTNVEVEVEVIRSGYWDRNVRFKDAIKSFSLDPYRNIGKRSDESAIAFCRKFVPSFDPDSQAVFLGEEKGADGFTYCYFQLLRILGDLEPSPVVK